jgi:predicted outer membrane repeat protein
MAFKFRYALAPLIFLGMVMTTPLAVLSSSPDSFASDLNACQAVQPVQLESPRLITDCTRAGIQAALDQGGQIRFSCGSSPITIPIDQTLELSTTRDTVLDGAGLVTLDGQNLVRIMEKGWHDPVAVGTVRVTLQNLRFINGRAPSGSSTGDNSGGAIEAGHPGTYLTIIDSTFENNATRDYHVPDNQGGAIFFHNGYQLTLSNSVFSDNSAGNGGAIGIIAGGLQVANTLFSQNQALDDSGGDIVRGYGGAIHVDGVSNSYNPDSSNRISFCGDVFEGNSSYRGGGAVGMVVSDNLGTLVTIDRSTFDGNQAAGSNGEYGQGGGVYYVEDDQAGGVNETNLIVQSSTFHGNQALRQGGALWISVLGFGQVTNSTFESNRTTAGYNQVGQGGAVAVTLGNVAFTNVVFANNHADYQGGALHGGGDANQITLTNTIFWNNTLNEQDLPSETRWQGYHTNRPMLDGGGNIQFPRYKPTYDNDVNNWITANPIFADPRLQGLADNGGPTLTMAPQPGSPAIDQGISAACPGLDQRGYVRIGRCDIGAVEFGSRPFIPTEFIYLPAVKR